MSNTTRASYRHLLALSIPMILSNITTPLLGMVDTAVMGHMGSVGLMAGASIGALVISQLYWVCGFLRMAITGVSAQAYGANDTIEQAKSAFQSVFLGACIGGLLIIFSPLVLTFGAWFAEPHPDIIPHVNDYIQTRLWGAPFALINFALLGWLIGQQRMKLVLTLSVIANLINGILDIVFVYGFDLGVSGLAAASVAAEIVIAVSAAVAVFGRSIRASLQINWLHPTALSPFLRLNHAILFRNLALQGTLAFITFEAARLGQEVVAVNAILMQFFVLSALGLDGIAQATEATVGEAKGQRSSDGIIQQVKTGVVCSSLFAVLCTVIFAEFSADIIQLLTDIPHIVSQSLSYQWVIVLLPIIGHWCFVFDGVFVALTRGIAMQNSMIISTLSCFFPVYWLLQSYGNTALWIAMLCFLLARGVTLGAYFVYLMKKERLVDEY